MDALKEVLNTLPEVRWDRYTTDNTQTAIYGWIRRKDKKFDFIILYFIQGQLDSFVTSSAQYSKSIHKRLGFLIPHVSCRRVEELFPNREVNCIRLKQ